MYELFIPAALFGISMLIRPVREMYMSFIDRISTTLVDTVKTVKLVVYGCRSGDLNVGLLKDYTLHRARHFSSHHLSLGKLEYDAKRKIYDLTYFKGGSEFHIIIPRGKNRGPRAARKFYITDSFEDGDSMNVTKEIIPFLGVTKDFHSIPTTPRMLGYSKLKVVYNTGAERVFRKNDVICLRPPEDV